MSTLLLISLLSIVCYIVYTLSKVEDIPTSISATVYRLGRPWLFMAAMFVSGFTLLPVMLEVTPDTVTFVPFLAASGLLGVGASPRFKEGTEGAVHTVSAAMLLTLSQAWVAIVSPWMLLCWLPLIAYLMQAVTCRKGLSVMHALRLCNPLFWAEIIVIITTYMTLILEI